jgi:hypothetical protein
MDGTGRRRRPPAISRNGRPDRAVADWLDQLFATVRPPGGSEYSNVEVARALRRAGGPAVSARTLGLLRSGELTNPTIDQIQAISAFFGTSPVGCFGADARARLASDLATLDALRNPVVRAEVAALLAGRPAAPAEPVGGGPAAPVEPVGGGPAAPANPPAAGSDPAT